MSDEKMSLDDAAATLNRVLKEHKALNRLHDVIEIARQCEGVERQAAERKKALEAELHRLEGVAEAAAVSIAAKKEGLQQKLSEFEEELRNKRDRVERDFAAQMTRLAERQRDAGHAVKQAEADSAQRIAEVMRAAERLEGEHGAAVKERQAEISRLDELVKAARREMEALRNQLGSR